jgi:hypothetical protein
MNQAVPRTDWTWKDAFRVSSTDAIALKVLGTVVALAVVGFAIWLVCLVITDHINDSVAGNVALSVLSVLVAIAGAIVGLAQAGG